MRSEMISEPQKSKIIRSPRRWVVVWTWGTDDQKVIDIINKDLFTEFEGLLEIHVSEHTPGYIFLRVSNPHANMFDSILSISGVGGFLTTSYGISLEHMRRMKLIHNRDIITQTHLDIGSLVEIVCGPLTGMQGKVTSLREKMIDVSIMVVGRLMDMEFQIDEVQLVKELENA